MWILLLFIIGSKNQFIHRFIGLRLGELERRLSIIQKHLSSFTQSYKFLFELTVLVTASSRFAIVFDHFHLGNFTVMPTSP